MKALYRVVCGIAAITTLHFGCKGQAGPAPEADAGPASSAVKSSEPPGAAARECASRTEELSVWTRKLHDEGSGPPQQMTVHLAEQPAGTGERFGAALVIHTQELWLDAQRMPGDSLDKLPAALKERRQAAVGTGFPLGGLDLYVDKQASWSLVAGAVEAAFKSGFRQVTLVFAAPSSAAPPPKSALFDRLEAAQREADDAEPSPMDAVAEDALRQCPPAQEPLRKVLKASGPERVAKFAELIPPALLSCQCKADLDGLRAVPWFWLRRTFGPPTVGVIVKLAAKGDAGAVKVTAAKADTWSSASVPLLDAARQGKAVTLAIK